MELLLKTELPKAFHEEILHHFNLYALTGGMLEVVARYAASKDIVVLSRTYNQILSGTKEEALQKSIL